MKTVINISNVTDYSGEPPIITYSNPVTTVINQPDPPTVIITRFTRCTSSNCDCCNCCNNQCGCQ